jgi:hypothetical protein
MNAPFVDFGTAPEHRGRAAALMDRAKSGKGQKVAIAAAHRHEHHHGHLIEQAMSTSTASPRSTAAHCGPSTPPRKDGRRRHDHGQPFVRWQLMGDEGSPRTRASDDPRAAITARPCRTSQKWCARTVKEALAEPRPPHRQARSIRVADAGRSYIQHAKFFHQMASVPLPVPVAEPVKLSRTPLTIRRRAPRLGEHTDQIYRNSAMSWPRSRLRAIGSSDMQIPDDPRLLAAYIATRLGFPMRRRLAAIFLIDGFDRGPRRTTFYGENLSFTVFRNGQRSAATPCPSSMKGPTAR